MAFKANLVIDQGSEFSTEFIIKDDMDNPIDFTEYTIEAKIKKTFEEVNGIPFNIIGYANGAIEISLDSNVSDEIKYGQYVWDLKAISPPPIVETKRIVEGLVQITPKVT
jgi:hypothetical protein